MTPDTIAVARRSPEYGFPAGTTQGSVTWMSWHGLVHSTAAAVAFTAPVSSLRRCVRTTYR